MLDENTLTKDQQQAVLTQAAAQAVVEAGKHQCSDAPAKEVSILQTICSNRKYVQYSGMYIWQQAQWQAR